MTDGSSERADSSADDDAMIETARREAAAAGPPLPGRADAGLGPSAAVRLGGGLQASSAGDWLHAGRSGSRADSDEAMTTASPLALSADSFTGYRILREIHRGGQGVVFQAIQESTKRKVALKVMKEGPFATSAEQARFDREVQVLGQLNHPNIVAIHDSGRAAGCHYFVMDYIRGQPLDVWMAGREHSIKHTLDLFAKICNAVNAAHLRGITHRDLKPGNIRVDDNGEPHILDFGLAKIAVGAGGGSAAAMTITGQFVGSLPWASPEQAEGVPGKIDLRTDVYSLGVIAYQMLTGKFPYDVIGSMRDVLDRIIRTEPVRPSAIRQKIDDEVETIVLKCLAKERERRYQSAGELGCDVERYLSGEPIEAKRDSAAYVLRKYLHRYRLPVAIAAGFVVLVTIGLIGSLTFWRQAVIERRRVERAGIVAEERRIAAEASEARAVAEAQRADREAAAARQQAAIAGSVSKLLNDMLAKANRGEQHGNPDVRVREILDVAAKELEGGQAKYEPEVEAAVRMTIGRTYRSLGLYDEAEQHLRAALVLREATSGHESLEVADSLENLSMLLMDKGQTHLDQARPLAEEALAICRRLRGEEDPAVAAALYNMGMVFVVGDGELAEPVLIEALALQRKLYGDEQLAVADILTGLGAIDQTRGDYESAERRQREALTLRRKLLGDEHLDIAGNLNDLAVVLHLRGEIDAAEQLYRDSLAMYRKLLGDGHPMVANVENHLAILLQQRGNYEGAEPLLRDSITIRRKLTKEDPQLAYTARNLGISLHERGDYAGAEALFRDAITVFDRCGYNSVDDCVARIGLGSALARQDRFAEAEPALLDVEQRLAGFTDTPPRTYRRAVDCLIYLYEHWDAAEPGRGHDRQAAEWEAKSAAWQATTQRTTEPVNPPAAESAGP